MSLRVRVVRELGAFLANDDGTLVDADDEDARHDEDEDSLYAEAALALGIPRSVPEGGAGNPGARGGREVVISRRVEELTEQARLGEEQLGDEERVYAELAAAMRLPYAAPVQPPTTEEDRLYEQWSASSGCGREAAAGGSRVATAGGAYVRAPPSRGGVARARRPPR